ncbi:MAG TPA: hypothetical protein VFZ63_00530 [Jiangellaceae bacterium]
MSGPIPGPAEFVELQKRLRRMSEDPMPGKTRTILVIPSFSVDRDLLINNPEFRYWEHRMLYLLSKLSDPATRMCYVSTCEVTREALLYYVDLLPDVFRRDLDRLQFITCPGSASEPLAERLLRRPDILLELRRAIDLTDEAYIECFASTNAEKELALILQVPMYGSDPTVTSYGLKSESRRLFRQLEIPVPEGVEGVYGLDQLAEALVELKAKEPRLQQAVVKLDDSLGGVGNALFSYSGAPDRPALREWVKQELLTRLELAMSIIDRNRFFDRIARSGCVVESFVDGARSPSVQCEIKPSGEVIVASTHEQQMTGLGGQHFSGCFLPATDPQWIQNTARLVGDALQSKGVIGWYGVDFVVESGPEPHAYALEINLRNLGTVHHLMTLRSLTGGRYVPERGIFLTKSGRTRFYYGSDAIRLPNAVGVKGSDLLAYATSRGWMYRAPEQTGVVLHMIDAMTSYGRIGVTCIGYSAAASYSSYSDVLRDLQELG